MLLISVHYLQTTDLKLVFCYAFRMKPPPLEKKRKCHRHHRHINAAVAHSRLWVPGDATLPPPTKKKLNE